MGDEQDDDSDFIAGLDRVIARTAAKDPLVNVAVGAINELFGNLFRRQQPQQQQQRTRAQEPPRARARQAPPPRPAPAPDPSIRAREILGFEPSEPLTADKINKRKQALAKVFHPDLQGGSTAQMAKVNAAADVLLAKFG